MSPQTNAGERVYTYRNGKKIYLNKATDQLVVRAKPEDVWDLDVARRVEEVSPSSTKVTVDKGTLDSTMEILRESAVTHHAYNQEDSGAEFLITDRIIVTFRMPVNIEAVNAFMAKYALLVREKYSENEYLFQLTDQTGMNPVKLVVQINETEKDLVENCEHDLNQRMMKMFNFPADDKYARQWHLHTRLNDPDFDPRASSKCEDAWLLMQHYGVSDVVIGVTDDGCKLDHGDFDAQGKFANWGYMSGSTLVDRDAVSAVLSLMYQNGADHGTCCCGVASAETDGALTVGAAPGCRLLPIKWQSSGPSLLISDSKMLTVLNFVGDKVDILSNSWGSSPEFMFSSNVISKITQLARNGGRRGKGIVFLWAAGNENCPISYNGNLDIPYDHGYNNMGNWIGINTSRIFEHNLVGIPGVMHIAALASNAQRSHYSNYGVGISVCAPSSNSHAYWRLIVPGLGVLTASGASPFFDAEFGGTSSATPLVAGIAALVISANPALTAVEVVSVLQRTADKDLNMNGYPQTPPSTDDPNTGWDISPAAPHAQGAFSNIGHADGTWSGWFGFGKVNAHAAVAAAMQMAGGPVPGSGSLTGSSSPAKAIPDNAQAGITDTIQVNGNGTISGVKVDVDIAHTYIGDLVVTLTSPRGTPAVLHQRNGGSAHNLVKSYDATSAPDLARFNGEPASGTWTLSIVDAANADQGTLNTWKLAIDISNQQEILLQEVPGILIPDNDANGVTRKLSAVNGSTVKKVDVSVDITHTYVGDLIVNLISPKGTIVSLQNRVGGSADNLIKNFSVVNTPAMSVLTGEPIQGDWKLRVSDAVGQDTGKLNKWSVRLVP